MEHDELLLALPGQYPVEDRAAGRRHSSCRPCPGLRPASRPAGLASPSLEEEPLVGLFAQEVGERVVGALIAQKHGVETCLTEGLQDAFLVEEALKLEAEASERSMGTLLWVVFDWVVTSLNATSPGGLLSRGLVSR